MREALASTIMRMMGQLTTPFGFDIKQAMLWKEDEPEQLAPTLIAGDIFAFSLFGRVFEPLLCANLPPIKHEKYPFSFDPLKLYSKKVFDPRIVRSVHFAMPRSLNEHRFLPACQLEERREIQKALLQSFDHLPEHHKGGYLRLDRKNGRLVDILACPVVASSRNRNPWPGCLIPLTILSLNEYTNVNLLGDAPVPCDLLPECLFWRPESELSLRAGINRDWPDARGIYVSRDRNTYMTVNRDCHVGIFHTKQGGDLPGGYKEFCDIYRGIQRGLQRDDLHFAYDTKFGFVTWDTNRVGGTLTLAAKITIPHLEKHDNFDALLLECSFKCRRLAVDEGCVEVTMSGEFGMDDLETMCIFSYGLRRLVQLEKKMERDELDDLDMPSELSKEKAMENLHLIFESGKDSDLD